MKVRKLIDLKRIRVVPTEDRTEFRLILESSENGTSISTEVQLSSDGLMALMLAIQKLQEIHKIPIPPSLRPSGKPRLVVIDDST
jgi:hypothetical protein